MSRTRALGVVSTVLYLAALYMVTLTPDGPSRTVRVNLVPFRSIIETLTSPLSIGGTAYVLLGNVLLLSPLAVILVWLFRVRRVAVGVAILASTSIAVEVLQSALRTGRSSDVDDLILNIAGGVVVYLVVRRMIAPRAPASDAGAASAAAR